jgi:hypothetical protein
MSYGQFLLWSKTGAVRHLNAIADGTYKEWLGLVEQLRPDVDRASEAFLDLAQETYGPAVCDADPNGDSFVLGDPICPDGCGPMLNWEPIDERVDVPAVTHRLWDEADEDAKSEIGKRFLVF